MSTNYVKILTNSSSRGLNYILFPQFSSTSEMHSNGQNEHNQFFFFMDHPKTLCCRYEQEFIRQPNELMQKVVYRGNFDADFKDFLRMRGF